MRSPCVPAPSRNRAAGRSGCGSIRAGSSRRYGGESRQGRAPLATGSRRACSAAGSTCCRSRDAGSRPSPCRPHRARREARAVRPGDRNRCACRLRASTRAVSAGLLSSRSSPLRQRSRSTADGRNRHRRASCRYECSRAAILSLPPRRAMRLPASASAR